MNKTYRIPCSWQMNGSYYIEAESLEKALEIAEDSGLPEEAEFIDGSYEVDHEMVVFYNKEEKVI